MFIGGINLPFPVMGGRHGIVLPTLIGEYLSLIGIIVGYTMVKIGIINQ